MQRYIIYGDSRIPAPASVTSIEGAKAVAGSMIPGLSDASGHIDASGNFVFEKRAGTKGL
ncbi:MAG: hypothetical protein PHY47_00965 [Lachnospiraceae bacterium]|nr:hypothetical protein [Lachnospiraceae bacterium]